MPSSSTCCRTREPTLSAATPILTVGALEPATSQRKRGQSRLCSCDCAKAGAEPGICARLVGTSPGWSAPKTARPGRRRGQLVRSLQLRHQQLLALSAAQRSREPPTTPSRWPHDRRTDAISAMAAPPDSLLDHTGALLRVELAGQRRATSFSTRPRIRKAIPDLGSYQVVTSMRPAATYVTTGHGPPTGQKQELGDTVIDSTPDAKDVGNYTPQIKTSSSSRRT